MSNMAINTNILALNSHRSLKGVGAKQEKASNRLSSGYRINSAADDAAGLAISEKMRAQVRGLDMASKNTQDAISLIQTAEGGMQEIDNMLQRIRELTVQASNDTNDQTVEGGSSQEQGDRVKIQDEINQLVAEIDSMADRVEFNKKKVINGSYAKGSILEKGDLATARETLNSTLAGVKDDILKSTGTIAGLITAVKGVTVDDDASPAADTLTTSEKATVLEAMASFEAAVRGSRTAAEIDDARKALVSTIATLPTGKQSQTEVAALNSAIADSGTFHTGLTNATEAGSLAEAEAAFNAAKSIVEESPHEGLYFQVGANSDQKMELSINSLKSDALGIGDGNGVSSLNVVRATGSEITSILDTLDTALTYVTTERSKLGAAQNRLEYTQKSLDISSENLTASESRIRDTDMAKEMMNFTQANVLQQAATSMLAQANQSKQGILQLLQ